MPELPEVETIRRRLAPLVQGRTLERLTILDPRWCAPRAPHELSDALEDRAVRHLGRRGKYLVCEADDEVFLLMHLRMTGTLLYDAPPDARYVRVRFEFDDGHVVSFCDPRRFGTGQLVLGEPALEAFLAARLGVEPLGPGFTSEALYLQTRNRRAPIKAVLLDQRRVAGVGNIYANEALFRAKVHPLREAGRLTRSQLAALRDAVIVSLEAGIDAGGATIDDFRHPDGVKGAFQNEFLVHGRTGEPCFVCGGPIVKFVAAGRGTYACETCQPRPRRRRTHARAGAKAESRAA
ncbi:MAG TPA: bifunctional DNA-formamidopyrimidine glycosylase/DNA-(apurinic or apyrimidinic site) lyase [Solirubrobacteraceae bacterium]|jgi:formamidopyrimidine-DNA glycosylase|nr:bifunctional DNA-formamidopyrimidine glycosylase/DNA-(apurinic or apyrimidinic site) lyase [Solirubrobacteraceae bacterium]